LILLHVKFSILVALFITIYFMQLLWELWNGERSVGMSFCFGGKLLQVFQLVVQRYIYWSVSLCTLMINLFDHFSLFVQVYVHNLVTEDCLISQLVKLTDTSFSKTIWIWRECWPSVWWWCPTCFRCWRWLMLLGCIHLQELKVVHIFILKGYIFYFNEDM
jgi:hypothetical protein